MSDFEAHREFSQAPSPLAAELTAIRGQVRRLPESVAKERASLLAAQIENSVPTDFIRRQLGLMAG